MQNFFKSSCLQCSQSVCVISNFLSFCLNSSLHILGSSSLGWWLRPATSCSPATTLSISTSTASLTGDTATRGCMYPEIFKSHEVIYGRFLLSKYFIILELLVTILPFQNISSSHPLFTHHANTLIQKFSMYFYVVISELPFVICCCAGRGG